MNGMPQASVVIPTYQRGAALQRLLDALTRQTVDPAEFEVVVAVDGSTDGTREMLAALRTPFALRPLWQPNRGRAAACNAGLRRARGELVVLIDDDMEPLPEWLSEHMSAHSDYGNRAVLGAAPVPVDGATGPVARYVAEKFNSHLARLGQPGYVFKLRDLYSGNLSIRRRPLVEVGGFDEEFRLYGNEDLELAVRLQHAGVQFVFNPRAVALQHNTKDFAALARDHIAKGKTSMQLVAKHPEIYSQLRLASDREVSVKWRLARNAVLGATDRSGALPGLMIRFLQTALRLAPQRTAWLVPFALDYFYWLGVRATRTRGKPVSGRGFRVRWQNSGKNV